MKKTLQTINHSHRNTLHGSRIILLALTAWLCSCVSYKEIAYLQESDIQTIEKECTIKTLRIQPRDRLGITVSYPESPELAIPFNLTTTPPADAGEKGLGVQPVRLTYSVKNDGTIDFPILGAVRTEGLTQEELSERIEDLLMPHFKHRPIVSVQVLNFSISVLGEVNNPGSFTIREERITILEALALAGDLTIHGKRSNIMLVREDSHGDKKTYEINLSSRSILSSPQYYLQQNDIIYVLPNKTKANSARTSSYMSVWIPIVSSVISLASLLVVTLK